MTTQLNAGLQQIIDQLQAAEIDLRRCNEWYAARDEYIRESLRGDDDWTRMDDEASAEALKQIAEAARKGPSDEFHAFVTRTLAGLIQHAANLQADILERNGRLAA